MHMNKNTIIGILIVVLIIVIGVVAYFLINNNQKNEENNQTNETTQKEESSESTTNVGSNVLVVYFSAQGHTKEVAEKIADNLNADIFEITPANPYTEEDLDYNNDNSRVSREYEDESLRDVELETTEVPNWSDYDTVLIGYPIWWGNSAWPINSFVKANNFTGKTVIPFCTSASSSIGQSDEELAEEAGTGNWEEGHRFSSNPSDSDIKSWTDSLK
ncbi:MAG TPA: flavodoxin [Candidatus Coprosoma intestinipullorum]|uniref:Flavodoxin n=1 Tax=Candidatus Coprosoma intestinipullorum TaxID=2840752 RepID=A0A9D0ZSF8_9FIRM|nr:flavodoxin [Candidatus Coprosoma intestinipullorum]